MKKNYARQFINIEFIKTRKRHLQACNREGKAMLANYPGASLIFYMFINLLIKLLPPIYLFHFILFISFLLHFNWFNKIYIVICNVDQYGDMD